MIQIIRMEGLDEWMISFFSEGPFLKGNLDDVIDALESIEVDPVEIAAALKDLHEKNNNVAYFGVNKTFIYTDLNRKNIA